MKRIIWILPGLALVAMIGFIVFILSFGQSELTQPVDVAVVMGTKVEADGQPSAKLRLRLDKAYELFQSGQVGKLWVTGGRGISGHQEATVMQAYLIGQGVPQEAIQIDSLGISTYASARNLADEIPADASIAIISHTSHLRRTKFAFEQFGKPITTTIGVSGGWKAFGSEAYGSIRECLALPYYWTRPYE